MYYWIEGGKWSAKKKLSILRYNKPSAEETAQESGHVDHHEAEDKTNYLLYL
jgi:hypothetical protein